MCRGLHDPALEVDGAVAERGAGFGARGPDRAEQIAGAIDDAHALAAAAGDRLDDQRIADRVGRPPRSRRRARRRRSGCSVPGTTGTPARIAASRAAVLLPISAIASGDGPMNVRPASRQARANAAFSARKP